MSVDAEAMLMPAMPATPRTTASTLREFFFLAILRFPSLSTRESDGLVGRQVGVVSVVLAPVVKRQQCDNVREGGICHM